MMPWEHVVIGYIGFSLFVHVAYRAPPTAKETLVVAFASVLPDLVDKPLAWEFGLFASGRAVAHSLFVAIPVSILVLWIATARGRPRIGWAFAIGYSLHLLADVIPKYLREGEMPVERVLWPFRVEENGYETGFREEFLDNVLAYSGWISQQVQSGNPDSYFFVLFGLGCFGLMLWILDGMPVFRESWIVFRRRVRRDNRGAVE